MSPSDRFAKVMVHTTRQLQDADFFEEVRPTFQIVAVAGFLRRDTFPHLSIRIARQIIVLIELDANRFSFTLDAAQRTEYHYDTGCDSAQRASHKLAQGNALGNWFSSTKSPKGATLN